MPQVFLQTHPWADYSCQSNLYQQSRLLKRSSSPLLHLASPLHWTSLFRLHRHPKDEFMATLSFLHHPIITQIAQKLVKNSSYQIVANLKETYLFTAWFRALVSRIWSCCCIVWRLCKILAFALNVGDSLTLFLGISRACALFIFIILAQWLLCNIIARVLQRLSVKVDDRDTFRRLSSEALESRVWVATLLRNNFIMLPLELLFVGGLIFWRHAAL